MVESGVLKPFGVVGATRPAAETDADEQSSSSTLIVASFWVELEGSSTSASSAGIIESQLKRARLGLDVNVVGLDTTDAAALAAHALGIHSGR